MGDAGEAEAAGAGGERVDEKTSARARGQKKQACGDVGALGLGVQSFTG